MNSKPHISLLYDFYGELLKDSQRQVVELYVNEDLSLAEVAENLNISRQGVYDSLTRAERLLTEYEEKLGLLAAYRGRMERNETILKKIHEIKRSTEDEEILEQLNEIEDLLRGDD